MPLTLASLLGQLAQLALGVAVVVGFVWLTVRLLSRMIGRGPESPVGRQPTDRTDDDEKKVW